MFSLILTFYILCQGDTHPVVSQQLNFWKNFKLQLVDKLPNLYCFFCYVSKYNIFGFGSRSRDYFLLFIASQNDCFIREKIRLYN